MGDLVSADAIFVDEMWSRARSLRLSFSRTDAEILLFVLSPTVTESNWRTTCSFVSMWPSLETKKLDPVLPTLGCGDFLGGGFLAICLDLNWIFFRRAFSLRSPSISLSATEYWTIDKLGSPPYHAAHFSKNAKDAHIQSITVQTQSPV